MLDGIPTKKVPEDNEAILPDDAEVLQRLRTRSYNPALNRKQEVAQKKQQASAQQQLRHLQQQEIILHKQIELQRVQQEQLEGEMKIQRQLHQLTLQQEQQQKQFQNPVEPGIPQQQNEDQ